MKRKVLVVIAIFSFALTNQAQFGISKLNKKIKKPKTSETKTVEQTEKTPANTTDTSKEVSTAQTNEAVILHNTILDGFNLALRNGKLQMGKLRAMNLPQSAADKHSAQMRIKNAGGQTLATFEGMPLAPSRNVSWLMNYMRPVDDVSREFKFTEEGDYYLEFSVNGQPFDKFAFSVAKHKHTDGSIWMIANGVWDELGLLEYNTSGRRPIFKFSLWMRDLLEGTGVRPDNTGKYTIKIIREKDNQTVGVSNASGSSTIYPLRNWKKFDFFFQTVDNVERFDAKSLLAQDGNYRVEFVYEGKPFGKYPFTVQNGEFQGIAEHKGEHLGTDGTISWMPRQK